MLLGLGYKESFFFDACVRRDGTRRVWVRVEPPHTRPRLLQSHPPPVPIPINGYNFFPYPLPDRVNGYPWVKIPMFTTH
jgi:hypothetical protein